VSFGFRAVLNPLAGTVSTSGGEADGRGGPGGPAVAEVLDFHRRLPGYRPTPLLSLPRLASELGVGELLVKAESTRFGLPSFKMLGASWATFRAVRGRLAELGGPPGGGDGPVSPDAPDAGALRDWRDVADLARLLEPMLPMRLAAATDGNHGRAVARMARWLSFEATIFVPAGTTEARVGAIEGEGAQVVVVDGGYDDAVARCALEAGPRCLVISDTSWPGYAEVPRWVIDGYGTMFVEIDQALARSGHDTPAVVVVPIGVGALAAATVAHFARGPSSTAVLGVEPTDAACATASALARRPVTLGGLQHSIMAGLNCGTPSPVAWPQVSRGIAGFVTIDDDWARSAVRALASCGIEAGETGAAALGGLMALQRQGRATPPASLVDEETSVLVLATEGASDVPAWQEIVGSELIG